MVAHPVTQVMGASCSLIFWICLKLPGPSVGVLTPAVGWSWDCEGFKPEAGTGNEWEEKNCLCLCMTSCTGRVSAVWISDRPKSWAFFFGGGVPTCRRISRWYRRSTGDYNTRLDIFHTLGRGQWRPPRCPIKPTNSHAWYSMGPSRSDFSWRMCVKD